jgi:hypothetical protein
VERRSHYYKPLLLLLLLLLLHVLASSMGSHMGSQIRPSALTFAHNIAKKPLPMREYLFDSATAACTRS